LIAVINDDNTRRYRLPSPLGLSLASKPEVNYTSIRNETAR